jgi:hypothetical protein
LKNFCDDFIFKIENNYLLKISTKIIFILKMSDFLLSLLYSDEQVLTDYIMKNKISTSNLIFLKESDYSNEEISFKLAMRSLIERINKTDNTPSNGLLLEIEDIQNALTGNNTPVIANENQKKNSKVTKQKSKTLSKTNAKNWPEFIFPTEDLNKRLQSKLVNVNMVLSEKDYSPIIASLANKIMHDLDM